MLFLPALLSASRVAHAACVITGARPTVPLPTMEIGQDFSFLASSDCMTLRFIIPDPSTPLRKIPRATGPTGPGLRTYKVHLGEAEWDTVVAKDRTTLTWVVEGSTSIGSVTTLVTTNELKAETITLELSMADAKLVGEDEYGRAGQTVSGAGDVDGDGHDDLLVGAPQARANYSGAAYVVLGPVTGTLDLSLADAKLVGEGRYDEVGRSVSGAGDVDGDGHDDVLVGAPSYNSGASSITGAGYLVLGPVTGTLDLSLADAKLVGEARLDRAGQSVSGAGDVDGDGHDDLLIGASENDEGGDRAGAAYLVLGPVTGTLDLSLADAKIVGEDAYNYAGAGLYSDPPVPQTGVCGAGDVNADGNDDVLVGAGWNDEGGQDAGAAYLVLGPVTGTLNLALADAKLVGEDADNWAASVARGGDVNGDGHDDLLVGSFGNDEGGEWAGAAYLVLGPVTGTLDLSRADAKLVGEQRDDWAGISVSGAGDVDGDGHDDLLVGAAGVGEQTGAAYLMLGPATGTLDLSRADAKLTGEHRDDYAGLSVSGAGDVDADGRADLLVGAPRNGDGFTEVGVAYLVYGGSLF